MHAAHAAAAAATTAAPLPPLLLLLVDVQVCLRVCVCVCVHVSFSFFGCLPVQLQIRPLEHLLFYFGQHASGLIAQLVRAYGQ